MANRTKIFVAVGAACLVLGLAVVAWGATTALSSGPTNVVVIMTDDQALESIGAMPNVENLLAAEGTTFSNYYVATPNCCPSRAAFYRGQYPHNNGVWDNYPAEKNGGIPGGNRAFRAVQDEAIGVWMQRAGYYTMHAGKYLNGWGNPDEDTADISPPPGWTHWFSTIDPFTYAYYNYEISNDGTRVAYGDAEADYQTDVLGNEVVSSISSAAEAGEPFFVTFTPLAPHSGRKYATPDEPPDSFAAVSAPRHDGMYAGSALPDKPNRIFGAEALTSPEIAAKSPLVRQRFTCQNCGPANLENAQYSWEKELESLTAVDEWVGQIYRTLDEQGVLDDTLIIFTSDNGLFRGEHGLTDKGLLYEEAVHVPLIIRGPGFGAGETRDQLVNNVDLAPTILRAAGAPAAIDLDGVALQDFAADPDAGQNRGILLETKLAFTTNASAAIRVGSWSYIEWYTNGQVSFRELYELGGDPYQMTNLADDPQYASVVSDLANRLTALRSCAGDTCER